MPNNKAKELLEKYKADNLSEEEKAMVEKWLFNYQEQGDPLSEEVIETISNEIWDLLPVKRVKTNLLWKRLAVASCLLISTGAGLLFYINKSESCQIQVAETVSEPIQPGGNKAILTLANGEKISLTDADKGELVTQSGIRISKTKDGQLKYQVKEHTEGVASALPEYNTVETPRGGQYQVDLPDGTKVWLNAGTSLKFPLSFSNVKMRKVELIGEAYFEVKKDVGKPFIVCSNQQVVQVIGTHFNVSAYADETVETTLLEGSVRVSLSEDKGAYSRMLKPGQQSQIKNNSAAIDVSSVDTQMKIAWKNGQFSFENEPIENIMRQISRWYDVDVVYEDNVPGKTVWGTITKYSEVSKVLSILQKTGKIHFRVEGRAIIVSK